MVPPRDSSRARIREVLAALDLDSALTSPEMSRVAGRRS
jgi:hypothetical protein